MIVRVVRTSGIVIAKYSTIMDVCFVVFSVIMSVLKSDYGSPSVWKLKNGFINSQQRASQVGKESRSVSGLSYWSCPGVLLSLFAAVP
jgi:hypothetical protein